MENKKNLQINCAVCDARNVNEEVLNAYESVQINAATVITSQTSQALLGKYAAQINCANTLSLADNVRFSTINGPMTVSANQAAA